MIEGTPRARPPERPTTSSDNLAMRGIRASSRHRLVSRRRFNHSAGTFVGATDHLRRYNAEISITGETGHQEYPTWKLTAPFEASEIERRILALCGSSLDVPRKI